jgi:hypothetical protein
MQIFIEKTPLGDFEIKLKSDDSDAFMSAIATLKNCVQSADRAWRPATKSWCVDASAEFEMGEWLALCTSEFHAEVVRAKEKQKERQTRTTPKPKEADPFAALYVLPTAPVEVVRAAYRALATIHHPDHGGDAEKMKVINAAYSAATHRLKAA